MYRSELSMLAATAAIAVTLGMTENLQNPAGVLLAEDTLPQTQQGSDKTPPVPGNDTHAVPSTPKETKSDKQPDSKAPPQ